MALLAFPRPGWMAGGDFALLQLDWASDWTIRTGFNGFIELEFDGRTDRLHAGPLPGSSKGRMLWRGAYAYFIAVAPLEFGRRICNSCNIEWTLEYRHESQHYTGSNSGGEGEDVSEQPYVGDAFVLDVALSERLGHWYFAERAIVRRFLPERSSYRIGFGADVHARWMAWRAVHPFTSLYGEWVDGEDLYGRQYPDAYRLRGLLGFALPSALGDILVFGSADVGNRYGVRILTEEATLGLGVRLVIGARPP